MPSKDNFHHNDLMLHRNTLILDHNDSYTFNLFQLCHSVSEGTVVVVNYKSFQKKMLEYFDNVILSPGPGSPHKDFDSKVLESANIPVLGVCLGHQGIALYYGSQVGHGHSPMHGRITQMNHNGNELFDGIPEKFLAVEYHSLVIQKIKEPLQVICTGPGDVIMGIKHSSLPLYGVQFHPESICTEYGRQLLMNFYKITPPRSTKVIPDWIMANHLIPRPLSFKYKGNRLKVVVKKLSIGNINTEEVYSRLFRDKQYAFFLDSSKLHEERGRFSYIGCADGPLAYAVSYKLDGRDLKVLKSDGTESESKLETRMTFFKWISEQISESHVDPSLVTYLNCTGVPFDFFGGFVGTFGYEMKQECYHDTNFKQKTASNMHDASFLFIDRFLAVDHKNDDTYLVVLQDIMEGDSCSRKWFEKVETDIFSTERSSLDEASVGPSAKSGLSVQCRHKRLTYIENINKCLNYIKDGDSYELCLTTQFSSKLETSRTSAWNFYKALRKNNPAPYGAFFSFSENILACSSPELFMKVDGNSQVMMKPIKGTMLRVPFVEGEDYEEWLKNDLADQQSLANSEKDLAENLMIVDLIRNDLTLVCRPGTVNAASIMKVESYATVHQLVSTIKGELRENMNAVDAMMGCFPPGSMTGAPKLRSMEILETLEEMPRGAYSGSFGYLSVTGSSQFNVIIRSAIFDLQSCSVSVGAGGAIISLSSPEGEWDEMLLKSNSVLKTLNDFYSSNQ